MNLEQLFNPKSIAIVGASEEEGKVGNVIAKNILTLGYSGKVFLVNPKHEQLFGQQCYKSLAEIQEAVDLAVIVIPAKFVADEIKNNADKIKNYVIISAGFSETGEEGKNREAEIKKIADEKGLNILGPNCLGFISPAIKLNATFAGGMPQTGNIAIVSQSGALAVAMLDIAEKENYGFSSVVSIGNKMSLDESEVLEFLSTDEKTKVIGMYLEGIKNGERFVAAAAKVSKIKPIVLLKAGKTEKSQKAISSHTGALAGSDEIISAICEKVGIMRAENLEEFFDLINLISLTDPPKTDLVVALTNAGGPGVLATDAFKGKNIKLADISDKNKAALRKFLRNFYTKK
jgi:acetyltransferase